MIKNRLSKVLITLSILSSVAMADTMMYPEQSLIGIEGGVTNIQTNYDSSTLSNNKTINKTVGNMGIKIGAESHDYRLFLTANAYTKSDSSYNYIETYGGELDYLLNVSKKMNIYFGINGGIARIKFKPKNEVNERLIKDPYYGTSAGLNFHASKLIDLELGARFMFLDASNKKNGVTYTFDNFTTAYVSLIFKYKTD